VTQDRRDRPGAPIRRALTFGIERALAPCTGAIVSVSASERDTSVRDGVAPAGRFVVVPNGVPLGAPAMPDPRLAGAGHGSAPRIGFLSRLSDEKGPLLLIRALSLLRERGIPFRGALVGDGPQRAEVEDAISHEGLRDVVEVLPFSGTVEPTLAAFDLYVLPSRWESLPIGVLEAMAAALPVVATDVGGTSEAVVHERTGLLVPPDDPEALADAIARLLGDEALRRQLGEAGRQRCEELFSVEAMVRATVDVYRRVSRRDR
jgi:glycosyltransferase involved in cell wall biosynthesis